MVCSALRAEYLRWFKEALWAFDTAKILYREARYNAAAFYAHQAAELAAKALLYHINEAPWGHNIRILLERYFERENISPPEPLLEAARELDRHYIPARYPNAHPNVTPHEAYDKATACRALRAAEKIIEFVRGVIGYEQQQSE